MGPLSALSRKARSNRLLPRSVDAQISYLRDYERKARRKQAELRNNVSKELTLCTSSSV